REVDRLQKPDSPASRQGEPVQRNRQAGLLLPPRKPKTETPQADVSLLSADHETRNDGRAGQQRHSNEPGPKFPKPVGLARRLEATFFAFGENQEQLVATKRLHAFVERRFDAAQATRRLTQPFHSSDKIPERHD